MHQGRVADAEVVDCETDTLDPKAGQRVHQLDQRLGRPFGQFEHQRFGRHFERPRNPFDHRKGRAPEKGESRASPFQGFSKGFQGTVKPPARRTAEWAQIMRVIDDGKA